MDIAKEYNSHTTEGAPYVTMHVVLIKYNFLVILKFQ